jgi:hypothetical protein
MVTLLPIGLYKGSKFLLYDRLREQSSDKSFIRLNTCIMVVKQKLTKYEGSLLNNRTAFTEQHDGRVIRLCLIVVWSGVPLFHEE